MRMLFLLTNGPSQLVNRGKQPSISLINCMGNSRFFFLVCFLVLKTCSTTTQPESVPDRGKKIHPKDESRAYYVCYVIK